MLVSRDYLNSPAAKFAIEAHGDQMYGDEPYINHLLDVVQVLIDFGYDSDEWIAAGFLHDVLEDTNRKFYQIRDRFGDIVAMRVWAVTGVGPSRNIRNNSIYEKVSEFSHYQAAILKVADRIANCERGGKLAMYRDEYPEFLEHVASNVGFEMRRRLENAIYGPVVV